MNTVNTRLSSIDALRGCTVAAMLLVNDPGLEAHVYAPLEHATWYGCTPTDLIFPFFLFIVGVSTALAFGPRLEQGAPQASLARTALKRALRIVLLGLAINVLAWLLMPDERLRIPGVLQRIGLCFAGTSLFAIYARPRIWWAAIATLLLGYWALLLASGSLEPWVNIVSRTDSAVFGHTVYQIDAATGRGHDPEGLLGTLPSLATSLLGLCAGQWLRKGQTRHLVVAGIVSALIAIAWSHWLPFSKNLWTPSFALWCAGLAMLAVWLFHFLVDQHRLLPLGRRFGVNAVAAYAGAEIMQILIPASGLQNRIESFLSTTSTSLQLDPRLFSLAYAIVFVAIWWVIVWAMDRRRIYIKL
ncbi:putative acyltransferase [Luteibacter rhizovicinus]|uniref:Putative acyltransferase n=1 Tax=Luteibacter rhizovicinus TaxID=242606 RepID=A0A4R3YYH6_9GAMM|nr:heparan-alpha-glucosaminide N-acetyltransferase domain-containing protein [Luteibacter rhizovicinus]TCV97666.1 putative acyltransferase [Luteibacter rhizovicinus]